MRTLLSDAQLTQALDSLDGWAAIDGRLRRTLQMPSFAAAIELVDEVAEVADSMDHHPDIDIRYADVTFLLTTHSAGGVTALDVELAGSIDRLAVEVAGQTD